MLPVTCYPSDRLACRASMSLQLGPPGLAVIPIDYLVGEMRVRVGARARESDHGGVQAADSWSGGSSFSPLLSEAEISAPENPG